jgi:hypothetical protein
MMQLRPALETSPVQEILARLDDLATIFRDSAAEGDRLARLPKYVVRALVQHGLFRLWIPKRCAGFELDLPEALQIYEAAARLDGSIGWAVMIGSGGGLFAAYLDASTANAIYARPEAVVAGSGAPDAICKRWRRMGRFLRGTWERRERRYYRDRVTAGRGGPGAALATVARGRAGLPWGWRRTVRMLGYLPWRDARPTVARRLRLRGHASAQTAHETAQ